MIIPILLLAVSLSIDGFSVGLSYGLRKIQISKTSLLIISILSISYSLIAILLGKNLYSLLPSSFAKPLGITTLILIGTWLIIKSLRPSKKNKKEPVSHETDSTLLKVAIKSLGITIQVIKNPSESDIDHSGNIDIYESIILGLALSVDAIGTGIGSSLTGFSPIYLPLVIGITQLTLLNAGISLGRKACQIHIFNEKTISILSGALLIILGLIRI